MVSESVRAGACRLAMRGIMQANDQIQRPPEAVRCNAWLN
jgi:hypothetical protein